MTFPFNPQQGLIVVTATLEGPTVSSALRLALHTGATDTAVDARLLRAAGYDPAKAPTQVEVTMGGGIVYVPVLTVSKLTALGHVRTLFPILAHTLPPSAGVDGVLGLDFLRGQALTIDFRAGQITLS
jgi:hypothetical protein